MLLSGATAELVADHLPDGADLVNLGAHRLRDLGRAERVFALSHPDLAGGVPPLRSLDELPNNLPVQLTSFVGRDRELIELGELLDSTRLLTLTGAGGCGKTRLALQLAADALDRYPGGAWWLELAPLSDPALIESALATMRRRASAAWPDAGRGGGLPPGGAPRAGAAGQLRACPRAVQATC